MGGILLGFEFVIGVLLALGTIASIVAFASVPCGQYLIALSRKRWRTILSIASLPFLLTATAYGIVQFELNSCQTRSYAFRQTLDMKRATASDDLQTCRASPDYLNYRELTRPRLADGSMLPSSGDNTLRYTLELLDTGGKPDASNPCHEPILRIWEANHGQPEICLEPRWWRNFSELFDN